MSDELPKDFTVESGGILRKQFEADVFKTNGTWKMQTTVKNRLRSNRIYVPFEIDEEHARRMYERYEVVDE